MLEPFRFAMAFENANVSGYVTEKIVNAFLAGAIPIYWGHPDVFKARGRWSEARGAPEVFAARQQVDVTSARTFVREPVGERPRIVLVADIVQLF